MSELLQSFRDAPVRVLVVWEPVVWTDAFRPKAARLTRTITDARAAHYWDPGKSLSKDVLESPWTRKYAVRGGPPGVVWDWIACYPPGVRWGSDFPEPAVQDFPIIDGIDRVRAWLDKTLPHR